MHFLTQLLLLVGIFAVGWWIYRLIKGNPSAFSRENLGPNDDDDDENIHVRRGSAATTTQHGPRKNDSTKLDNNQL